MEEYSLLGKRVPRIDGKAKASGQAKYASDLEKPGMLWGRTKRSPYPHARILNMDCSKAERLPGVKAIVTSKDPEFARFTWGFGLPGCPKDERPLAVDKVLFVGEPVAAVAAIDEEIAQEAVDLIDVEYEELPAVTDFERARDEGAPQLHEGFKNNVSYTFTMDYGDVEKAFRESDHIREDTFKTFRTRHGFIEPHCALAYWDDASGVLTLEASKQSPYFTYRLIAACFRLPLHKMRLIQPYIGGGFGGKNDCFALDYHACLLAKKTGKPVKIAYSLEESYSCCWRKHTMTIKMKTGVKKDGTLMGIDCHLLADGGAFSAIGPLTMYLSGAFMTIPYKLPNIRHEAVRVFTNYVTSVAMQGHGTDHTRHAAELQLDMIAEDLGIDPVDIRLRNAIPNSPYKTVNGIELATCGLTETIERAAEEIGWKEKKNEKKSGTIRRGVGFGCAGYITGARLASRDASSATLRIHEDGTVSLNTGAQDAGQGSDTLMCQIVAEELGISVKEVQLNRIDTAHTPIDLCTAGSRVTFLAGHATRNAVLDVKRQLQEFGGKMWEANPEDIVFKDHQVYVEGSPDKGVPYRDFIRMACYGDEPMELLGRGYQAFNLPKVDIAHGSGKPCHNCSFATVAAEVEVDAETGKVKVIKTVASQDYGKVLNLLALEGQSDQQVSHAIGMALSEDIELKDGRILNPTLEKFRMPRASDVPMNITIPVETNDPYGPYGAKEGSESIQTAATPAIINAIHNATGVWIQELPATPDKILAALKAKRQGKVQVSLS